MEATPTPCPETETLSGFVEGRFEEGEREALERHLESCASCRRAMIEFGRALRSASDGEVTQPSPTAEPQELGGRLGRYTIRRQVGAGGMGVVYEGFDPALSRRVALKILRPDRTGSAAELAAEARTLAKVVHPNVLTVFDVGLEEGVVFLAAEFVEGTTLDRAWKNEERPVREILKAYVQAARGLAAVHAAGIVHRDVKPANLLLGHDGRVRVTDFGLAVESGERAPRGGTPAYMSPEQLRGDATPRSDQFALAVCLAEALTGKRFAAGTKSTDLAACAPVEARFPLLWKTLARALSVDPSERFLNLEAWASEVEHATAKPVASRSRLGIVLGLGLLAAAATTFAATRRSTPLAPSPESVTTHEAKAAPPEPASASSPPESEPAPASAEAPAPSASTSDSATPTRASAASPAPQASSTAPAVATPPSPVEKLATIQEASEALQKGDAKRCLALLDKARAADPSNDGGTQLRAICEMAAGRCEQGFERLRADPHFGEAVAVRMRRQYCPVASIGSVAPEERLQAVWHQSVGPPYATSRCARNEAEFEKAVRDHGSRAIDKTARAGAVSGIAVCFAAAGDCKSARRLADHLFADPARAEKWVTQLHTNCGARPPGAGPSSPFRDPADAGASSP